MSETKAVIKTHQMLTRSSASRYLAQDTIIPAGYLMISSGAFSGQNKIYTLKFPRDLVSIKSKAFYSCQYLKEVCLPHSVQELGRDAFSECYRLRKVYISNKLETIPDHCFSRDGKLNRVLFTPSSTLTSIGTEAFYECGSLPYILLPPHVTSSATGPFTAVSLWQRSVFRRLSGISAKRPFISVPWTSWSCRIRWKYWTRVPFSNVSISLRLCFRPLSATSANGSSTAAAA